MVHLGLNGANREMYHKMGDFIRTDSAGDLGGVPLIKILGVQA